MLAYARRQPAAFLRLVGLLNAGLVLVYLALVAGLAGNPELRDRVSTGVLILGGLLATVALASAAWYRRADAPSAWLAWGMLAAAQSCGALGNLALLLAPASSAGQPPLGLADVLFLAFYPLFLLGVLRFPADSASRGERLRRLLDLCLLALAAGLVFWTFWLGPVVAAGASGAGWLFSDLAYPLGDLLLILALLVLLSQHAVQRPPLLLLAAGAAVLWLTDLVFNRQLLLGAFTSGSYLDVGWLLGSVLLGLAGLVELARGERPAVAEPQPPARSARLQRALAAAPYAILAAAVLLLLWGRVHLRDPGFLGLGLSLAGLLGLVLLRDLAMVSETNRRLRAEQRRRAADAVLLGLSSRLLAAADERAVAECVAEVGATALQGDFGLVILPNGDGQMRASAGYGWPPDLLPGLAFALGEASQVEATLSAAQPIVVDDYARASVYRLAPAMAGQGIVSGLSVPLSLDGRQAGCLVVHSRLAHAFDEDDVRLLALIANQAAAAIDRTRLFEVRRRQLDELTVLHAVATAGAEAVDPDDLIDRVTRIVGDSLFSSNMGVLLVDRDARLLRSHPSYRGNADFVTPLGQGITGHVALTGQPARVNDVSRDPRYLAFEPGIRSELCVPMAAGELVIGVINVESAELNAFSEADERLLVTIARQLATALEKLRLFSRLYQAEQQRAGELEAVRQASLGLTASLDLQAVLSAILHSALRLVPGARDAFIFLYHAQGGGRLAFGASRARDGRPMDDWEPRPHGLTYTVARQGEMVIVPNTRDHPLFAGASSDWGGAIVGLPLKMGARVVGVMNVSYDAPRAFPESELRVLRLLGDQAAIAIENARLFQAERVARAQAEALREVAATLNSSLDREHLLQLLLDQLARVVSFDSASVMLFSGDALAIVAQRGFRAAPPNGRPQTPDPPPHLADVIEQRRPLIIGDTTADPRWRPVPGTEHSRCWLGAPLIAQGRVIGLLNLDKEQPGFYTEHDAELAAVFASQAAVAIENARLFEAERRQLGLSGTLQSVGALLTAQMTLPQVFDHIFDLLAQVVAYDSVSVQLLLPDGTMELAAGRGFADMQAAREAVRYLSDHVPPAQWLEQRVQVIADTERDPRWLKLAGSDDVRSWIGAALVVKGKLVGVLATDSATPGAYDAATGDTVLAFANQAAVAIENARLFEESQRQTSALAALYNTALATGSVLETDVMLTRLYEQVRRLLSPDAFVVAFYHASSDELEVVLAVENGHAADDALPAERWPVSQGLAGWVTRNRQSLLVADLEANRTPVPPRQGTQPTRAWLGVPLIARDHILGAAAVQSFRPAAFDEADRRFMESAASQVAIAIENARLYSEAMARADELSRLFAAALDLGAKLEPSAVLEQLARHLTEAVAATSGYVVEVNLAAETLTLLAEYRSLSALPEERRSDLGQPYPLADHPTINRAVTRLSAMEMQADDPGLSDVERQALRRFGVRSALVVPIVARGEVLGEAEIWESRRVRVFRLAERRLLQTLCQHAAGVIQNARLFAKTLQHADEVTTVSEILHQLNATGDVVESFPQIAAAIKSITGCARVSMAMLDGQQAKVSMVALDQARPELGRGAQFPIQATAAAKDVLGGHVHLTPDLEAESAYPAERQLLEAGFRSRLNLPLRVGSQVIGALNLVWRETSGYLKSNMPLLTQLAEAMALALEKSRLYDETRRRDAILEALAYASGKLLLPGDPDDVMPDLLAQLGRAVGVSRAYIFMNHASSAGALVASLRHEWQAPGQSRKSDDRAWLSLPYRAGGFERWMLTLSAGRTLHGLVRDFPASERERLQRQEVLSLAVVPIISGGEWWGWLGFDDCQQERIWSAAEIEALRSVAGALGAFIARQQVETAEREQRALAEALRDTAAVLSSTLDLDEVLERILTDVGHVVPHESANIMLIEAGLARIARNRDLRRAFAEPAVNPAPHPVADVPHLRYMLETGQPAIIVDTRQAEGWPHTPQTAWIRSNVGAPIQIKGRVIGFITLDNSTPGFYTPAHAERLQAFAHQAGLAIENAQLYASIRQHAEELEQRVIERTRELAEANTRLQELDRLKDQFISNVSHELRTPLTNIKLHLGLLDKRGAEVLGRYLPTLQRETERLRRLIEDLLDLSRLQTQTEPLRKERHPLDELIAEVLLVHTARAEAKGLTLSHQLSPVPIVVAVDRAQMIQVFTNLIGNAVAYTPSGGHATVSASLARLGMTQGVSINFANDGPLIPPEDLPHLFERFYRGRTAHDSGEPGTGLGLAICREIVERHGGQIEVASTAQRGTVFSVWLPLN